MSSGERTLSSEELTSPREQKLVALSEDVERNDL